MHFFISIYYSYWFSKLIEFSGCIINFAQVELYSLKFSEEGVSWFPYQSSLLIYPT